MLRVPTAQKKTRTNHSATKGQEIRKNLSGVRPGGHSGDFSRDYCGNRDPISAQPVNPHPPPPRHLPSRTRKMPAALADRSKNNSRRRDTQGMQKLIGNPTPQTSHASHASAPVSHPHSLPQLLQLTASTRNNKHTEMTERREGDKEGRGKGAQPATVVCPHYCTSPHHTAQHSPIHKTKKRTRHTPSWNGTRSRPGGEPSLFHHHRCSATKAEDKKQPPPPR